MRSLRIALGILLTIIGLNALGGGYYGMTGAKDIPKEWLQGSPFTSYFIPSLFLFVVVGGVCLFGAVAAFKNSEYVRKVSFFCSGLLLCWIFIQVRTIGYVSWIQTAIFISALIIFGLAYFLKREPSRKSSYS